MKKVIIVTGASSGMGLEFVKQLDHIGADEIWGIGLGWEQTGDVNIQTPLVKMEMDLTDAQQIQCIQQKLEKENPNVLWLVNSAGFAKFGSLFEIPLDVSVNMINLNVVALVKLSEICVPYMSAGAKILQIASMAAFQSTPYMNVYGATKAFVLSYSRSLREELKGKKIDVTCLCPLWTKTKFFDVAEKTSQKAVSNFGKLDTPEHVVKVAIKKAKKGKEVCIVGGKSWWMRLAVKLFPHSLVMKIWVKSQKH